MSHAPNFNSNDSRTTLQRSDDWVRNEMEDSPRELRVHPQRTWHYYLAIVIAITLLLAVVTGTGAVVFKKSQNMIQRYVERMYGVTE